MRRYTSADDLAAAAFALADSRGTIPAQSIVVAGGERCGYCGGPKSTMARNWTREPARRKTEDRCADCRRPWLGVLVEAIKQKAKRSEHAVRPDATENSVLYQLDEWRLLEPIVYRRPRETTTERWIWTLSAWRLYLHPMLGSFASVAEYGMRWDARSRDAWGVVAVEAAISQGRSVVQARASKHPLYLLPRNGRAA